MKLSSSQKLETILNRIAEIFGVERIEIDKALATPRKKILRICGEGFGVVSESLGGSLKEIEWSRGAFYINEGFNDLVSSDSFKNGLFNLQNASSLLPPLVLAPMPGEHVLDLCAAPGIKTSHIYGLSKGQCFLDINEPDPGRRRHLLSFLEQRKVVVTESFGIPAQFFSAKFSKKYDKILVDAPCSGEGMIDISPGFHAESGEVIKRWNLKRQKALSQLQYRILVSALKSLKSGGTLVYSTCTFSPEENEFVINKVLSEFNDVRVGDIDIVNSDSLLQKSCVPGLTTWQGKNLDLSLNKTIRIFPSEFFEGFFVARLLKK